MQALESAFGYEEPPLHRAVITPKSYGTLSWIKHSAWVREVQHRPGGSSLSAKISIGRGAPVRMLMKNSLDPAVVRGLSSSFRVKHTRAPILAWALYNAMSRSTWTHRIKSQSGGCRGVRWVPSHFGVSNVRANIAAGPKARRLVLRVSDLRTALTFLFGLMTST